MNPTSFRRGSVNGPRLCIRPRSLAGAMACPSLQSACSADSWIRKADEAGVRPRSATALRIQDSARAEQESRTDPRQMVTIDRWFFSVCYPKANSAGVRAADDNTLLSCPQSDHDLRGDSATEYQQSCSKLAESGSIILTAHTGPGRPCTAEGRTRTTRSLRSPRRRP